MSPDALGDMDFKVAGTRDFVTALQLDTKLTGIPADVLAGALLQAREARFTLLDVMAEAIDTPDEMSLYAPRILTVGDLHREDPRRVEAHLVRSVDGLSHDVQQGEPGLAGLQQRTGEHIGRNAGELGVELKGGDEVTRTGDLEVHVSEGIRRHGLQGRRYA